MKTDLKRFSGYRNRFIANAEKQAFAWGNLRISAQQKLLPVFELALQEPFFIDDHLKGTDPLSLIMFALRDGEIFACLAEDQLIGICSFRDIKHGRSAVYDAWVVPEHRAPESKEAIYTLFREVMEYAFAPFPDGLGLKKVKADIAEGNIPALITANGLGFQQVGLSRLDAFHNGTLHDSVLLELLNPEFFGSAVEDIKPDEFRRGIEQAGTGTTVHTDGTSSSVCDTTGPAVGSATSSEREASDNPGELPGGVRDDEQEGENGWTRPSTGSTKTRQRSVKPRGRGPLRELLLPDPDQPADSISESSG